MARVRRAFLDSTVLVAGMIELGEDSAAPMALLDVARRGRLPELLTAWHCCLEFLSVTTRLPEEYRLEPDVALRFLRQEILGRLEVRDLPDDAREEFLAAAVAEGATGGRIYDAHIAEIARRAEASVLVTENRRHFASLRRHGLRVRSSAELLEELGSAPPPAPRVPPST